MKTTILLITVLLSLTFETSAQKPTATPAKLSNAAPCVPRQSPRRNTRQVSQAVRPVSVEPAADFFVGEAVVEVTKDQTVVRLAMAQHASVLIELPANDGPRYIIPGDPEMVTVDEKALEKNKRAIIVRPGSLFVVPTLHQKNRAPAATVTAQMRSGLVVTFVFYPVADLAQNVHRCVLSYRRDDVVARRRAAGLPVNLDQKEQGGEKPTGQSGAPASISVEPAEDTKPPEVDPANRSSAAPRSKSTSGQQESNTAALLKGAPASFASGTPLIERAVAAAKEQLVHVMTQPTIFKSWTRPLHGLALAVHQDGDLKEDFRVLLLAVRNIGNQSLKLIPGTPDLTLELHDDKVKVINIQSIKPLYTEASNASGEISAGGTIYYAIAYVSPVMSVRHRLRIAVAQSNATDEPASIALLK